MTTNSQNLACLSNTSFVESDFREVLRIWLVFKRKLWSSCRALSSRSEGHGFDPHPNARWKWFQSYARIDSYTQFWFIRKIRKYRSPNGAQQKNILKKNMTCVISTWVWIPLQKKPNKLYKTKGAYLSSNYLKDFDLCSSTVAFSN